MSITAALLPQALNLNTQHYSLDIYQYMHRTRIIMKLSSPILNTRSLPHTLSMLQQFLPSILKSRCFNEGNLPFCKEVSQTEVGHLFEHILLEYLCQIKISKGKKNAVFRGETRWNWKKYERGTFYIKINTGLKDDNVIQEALEKSVYLFNQIMQQPVNSTQNLYTISNPI